jgi:site-specific DNA-methyltransferase (adenine-specific)
MNIEDITNKIINADCLDILKQLPDKCVDLVLTDPPYGIKCDGGSYGLGVAPTNYEKKDWDSEIPCKEIFDEMKRVSKNQIICGGNYFTAYLEPTKGWRIWDKIGELKCENNFSECEMLWTSFKTQTKKYLVIQQGFIRKDKSERIHPTQKPIQLFEMALQEFSKENDLVLDCFSGSGTTAIACHNLKRRFICIEKDFDYWKASCKRLEDEQKQLSLL